MNDDGSILRWWGKDVYAVRPSRYKARKDCVKGPGFLVASMGGSGATFWVAVVAFVVRRLALPAESEG